MESRSALSLSSADASDFLKLPSLDAALQPSGQTLFKANHEPATLHGARGFNDRSDLDTAAANRLDPITSFTSTVRNENTRESPQAYGGDSPQPSSFGVFRYVDDRLSIGAKSLEVHATRGDDVISVAIKRDSTLPYTTVRVNLNGTVHSWSETKEQRISFENGGRIQVFGLDGKDRISVKTSTIHGATVYGDYYELPGSRARRGKADRIKVAFLNKKDRQSSYGMAVFGGGGNDRISGTAFSDDIWAGSGDDTVKAKGGDDRVSGGFGNDKIFGEGGSDNLSGDIGRDLIVAGSGGATIAGTREDGIVISAKNFHDSRQDSIGLRTNSRLVAYGGNKKIAGRVIVLVDPKHTWQKDEYLRLHVGENASFIGLQQLRSERFGSKPTGVWRLNEALRFEASTRAIAEKFDDNHTLFKQSSGHALGAYIGKNNDARGSHFGTARYQALYFDRGSLNASAARAKTVIAHEFGHQAHLPIEQDKQSWRKWIAYSWQQTESGKLKPRSRNNFVSRYAKTNPREDFAETFAAMVAQGRFKFDSGNWAIHGLSERTRPKERFIKKHVSSMK